MSETTIAILEQQWKDRQHAVTIFETDGKTPKPCPFCGGDKLSVRDEGELFWVHCLRCSCEGPYGLDRRHAIDLWQGRNLNTNKK